MNEPEAGRPAARPYFPRTVLGPSPASPHTHQEAWASLRPRAVALVPRGSHHEDVGSDMGSAHMRCSVAPDAVPRVGVLGFHHSIPLVGGELGAAPDFLPSAGCTRRGNCLPCFLFGTYLRFPPLPAVSPVNRRCVCVILGVSPGRASPAVAASRAAPGLQEAPGESPRFCLLSLEMDALPQTRVGWLVPTPWPSGE